MKNRHVAKIAFIEHIQTVAPRPRNISRTWKVMLAPIFLIGAALSFGSSDVHARTFSIDGFKISVLRLPIKDRFPLPESVTGEVLYNNGGAIGNGSTGSDPFFMLPGLAGVSPYLSILGGGSATFTYEAPVTSFTILWGTPDNFNNISFYDESGTLVGTLLGADFQASLGITENNRPFPTGVEDVTRITSSVAFQRVVLTTSQCCFEFSNVSAK